MDGTFSQTAYEWSNFITVFTNILKMNGDTKVINFLGTMMDILDIGMRDVTLRPYFTEIFFENGETREFMDRLLLECRLDKGLTNDLSHRSRNLLLKIFDEPKFLRRDLLDTLNIEKLLLLDISARIQNHDGIATKLHSEALATGRNI